MNSGGLDSINGFRVRVNVMGGTIAEAGAHEVEKGS